MHRIGVLYICTGKYSIFWKDFYLSCEEKFLAGHSKHYFVFTDADNIEFSDRANVTIIYQAKLGWPYDTLYRFQMFLKVEDFASDLDYLFFFNANALIANPIGDEVLPEAEGLVGVEHPCHYGRSPDTYIFERNSDSLAFVPYGSGRNYFMGSFNGGKTREFLAMAKTLFKNIKEDEEKGVIAIWHDESHLNRYFLSRSVKVLSPSYAFPEEMALPFKQMIVLRDKAKYGGHAFLRKKRGRALSYFQRLFRSGS